MSVVPGGSNNDLRVLISGDTTLLEKAFFKAENSLRQFSEKFQNYFEKINVITKGIGVSFAILNQSFEFFKKFKDAIVSYIITPIANAVKGFVELGDTLSKTSQRTGISVDTLGGLKFAAEQCGGNFEILTNSIRAFSNVLGGAKMGDQGMISKLGKMGINADMFGDDPEEQFMKLADHIASIKDPAEQAMVAMQLFGEAGYNQISNFCQNATTIPQTNLKSKTRFW